MQQEGFDITLAVFIITAVLSLILGIDGLKRLFNIPKPAAPAPEDNTAKPETLHQRLTSARVRLESSLDRLAALETVMVAFAALKTEEEFLAYVNTLGCKSTKQICEKLFLLHDGVNSDELAEIMKRILQRDVLLDRWEFAFDPITAEISRLCDGNGVQNRLWKLRRNPLRDECSNLQIDIEELEAAIRKEMPSADEPTSEPVDKRAKLKKLRVDITGKRLEEERLEKEILDDEQGEPIPNRRPEGVSTDD